MVVSFSDIEKQNIKNEIVERVSTGETLRAICREEGKPHWTTVYDWLNDDAEFNLRFARARELGFDAIAEECFDIADNANNDWMMKKGEGGQSLGWQLNGDHVQRDKMRIETRLKLLAKWSKKYSDASSAVASIAKPDGEIINFTLNIGNNGDL